MPSHYTTRSTFHGEILIFVDLALARIFENYPKILTYEGSWSWRLGSILRDDGEKLMIRKLMLLLRMQKVLVTAMVMLAAE